MKPLFAVSAMAFVLAACGGGTAATPAPLVAQPVVDSPFAVIDEPLDSVVAPPVIPVAPLEPAVQSEALAVEPDPEPTSASVPEPTAAPIPYPEPVVAPDPEPVVEEPAPEPVVAPDPEPVVEPPPLTDPTQYGLHTPATPMNPDRDNNGVPYLDKPVVAGTYHVREQFSTAGDCPIDPACEPWVWTIIDFSLTWADVEQATIYNVYGREWEPEWTISVADLPVPHDDHVYSTSVRLRDPDVLATVSQTTYQVEAKEFRGFTSGWTAPVAWVEVF